MFFYKSYSKRIKNQSGLANSLRQLHLENLI